MKIMGSGDNVNYAKVDEEGYLQVCLCDKPCDYHADLQRLLERGYSVLLHVHDKDGNIVPLKEAEE